ncbi:MAG: urea carboxylase [Frankiales bacterium]|nr:urea carboxylase [Frankiales bacterium]
MADNVLVVDRGVATVRVLRELQARGIRTVSVHTGADARSLHAQLADESVLLGDLLAAYGDVTKLIEAARQAGVQGVHPATTQLAGLEDGVRGLGLEWLGGELQLPVELSAGDGVVEARYAQVPACLPAVPSRAAEVVAAAGAGVAVSVEVVARDLVPVTHLVTPTSEDVWFDEAVAEGGTPTQSLLAVLTAWGADRDSAYALAAQAWDSLVMEGPDVPRPPGLSALGGPHV